MEGKTTPAHRRTHTCGQREHGSETKAEGAGDGGPSDHLRRATGFSPVSNNSQLNGNWMDSPPLILQTGPEQIEAGTVPRMPELFHTKKTNNSPLSEGERGR